jgi:hypothetical protein
MKPAVSSERGGRIERPLHVEAVGLAAPGLAGWQASRATLVGEAPYVAQDLAPYAPALLPPNERRRATPVVRLAFRTSEDALTGTPLPPADLATVFASSDGDTEVMHRINQALAQPARAISPTDFHNSVHNAAAGYWSIAVGAKLPSTSLAAHDASFAAALTEAAALTLGDDLNTLLTVCDLRMPVPLAEKRPIGELFGVALVLTPQRTARTLASLTLAETQQPETTLADAGLESLRRANPAARALPLLQLLARGGGGTAHLPGSGTTLSVTVRA